MEQKIYEITNITSVIGGDAASEIHVKSGDVLVAETAPGCWGPMITPRVFGGHEVTGPVYMEDAEPGDSVAFLIQNIEILGDVTATGTGRVNPGRFDRDPSVKAICPYCGIPNPETYLEGIGEDAIRCSTCGRSIMSQTFDNGFTVAYGDDERLAVAVKPEIAEKIAKDTLNGKVYLPKNAKQHPATILGRADLVDLPVRAYPMVGNIGCIPAKRTPASKNAGDYYLSIGKTDLFEGLTKEEINDAHMDIKSVGAGCIVISPVLVPGAGLYLGDIHLTQGDGEVADHTLDISARVTVKVELLKGLRLEGPVLIPITDELDRRFVPFTDEEYEQANRVLSRYGDTVAVRNYPIQIVGSGADMNAGLENALDRAEKLTGLPRGELKNRATVGGEIGIGRTSGMVYLTLMLEESMLAQIGILDLVRLQYGK